MRKVKANNLLGLISIMGFQTQTCGTGSSYGYHCPQHQNAFNSFWKWKIQCFLLFKISVILDEKIYSLVTSNSSKVQFVWEFIYSYSIFSCSILKLLKKTNLKLFNFQGTWKIWEIFAEGKDLTWGAIKSVGKRLSFLLTSDFEMSSYQN